MPAEKATAVIVNGHTLRVELASTSAQRRRGLSGRATLPFEAGMLFIFPTEAQWTFWMKDTLIPLDLVFLNRDARIVDIQSMKPEPGVPPSELRRYRSSSPAQYALEINAGLAEELGFQVGMQVEFR